MTEKLVEVVSPVPGWVNQMNVAPGDELGVDSVVAVIEVMKMMCEVTSGVAGTVECVEVEAGAMVNPGDTLVRVRVEEAGHDSAQQPPGIGR